MSEDFDRLKAQKDQIIMERDHNAASLRDANAEIAHLRARVAALEVEQGAAWEWRGNRSESAWVRWYEAHRASLAAPAGGGGPMTDPLKIEVSAESAANSAVIFVLRLDGGRRPLDPLRLADAFELATPKEPEHRLIAAALRLAMKTPETCESDFGRWCPSCDAAYDFGLPRDKWVIEHKPDCPWSAFGRARGDR